MAHFGGKACPPGVDNNFGPVVDLCARQFDFTLLFEQSILSIPPHAVFLLIAPWRIWSLRRYSQKTSSNWLSLAKLFMTVALAASQVALLVFYTLPYAPRTILSIPAAMLALASVIAIVPLSHLEGRRSVQPSTLINSYLAISAVLDIPQLRTLYLIPGSQQRHLATIFSVSFAIKLMLLGLEARNKRYSLVDGYRNLAPETTSSIFSRSLFLWMNSLFKRGYKKVICFEDLGPIDDTLRSTGLHHQLLEAWTQQDHEGKQPLLRSLWKALKWSILSPVPPRLFYSGCLFAQPFLINRAIVYLSQPQDTIQDDIGYGLIGAAACTYLGIALSNALFQRQLYRHITMVRGSLVSLIYTRSLSIEEQIEDLSAAVTLMSTDVDRICQSLTLLHDLWSRPLELAMGVTLLALQIGWVCIMPIAVVVISIMFDSRVTMMIGDKVKIWSDAVQRRISLTADVLSDMKSVKMLGLTAPLHWMLQNERMHELGLQAKFRWSVVWLNTLGNVPPALTAAITFIAYAIKADLSSTRSLNATQVFTSLALINLITTPASELLGAFPFAASCLGCLARIQTHILQSSRRDQRIFITSETSLPREKTDDGEKEETVVRLSQVIIPWTHDTSEPLLQKFDLEFRQNSLALIVGPSGSGKSTLLRAILGEARFQGTISIKSPRIAYCPQIPWLFTGTIKQNVCGLDAGEFDEQWYKVILYTCALDSYIHSLPQGDNTRIEGKTSTLSGGQKQRLILARALYQRPRLILLDDVLSALDIKTETIIMTRLFGTEGLMSRLNAAVVIVTHTHRWESMAETIVTLDGTGSSTQHFNPHRLNKVPPIIPGPLGSEKDSSESEISETLGTNMTNSDLEPEVDVSAHPPEHGSEAKDYIYYFKSVNLSLTLLFVFSAAAQTTCYYISQIILSWWATANGSDQQKWLPIYLLLSIGNAIMYGVTVWFMFLRIVPESAANLHRILLDVVMNAPYSFFTTIDVGMILNRFSQDMTLIESQLPTGVLCTLIYLFWTIGSLALISMGSSYMALTIPIFLITLFVLQRIYLRTSRRLRAIELELRSPLYSHFMESLKGLSSIRVLNWEDAFTIHMLAKLDSSQVPYYLLYCAQRWLQLVLDLIVTGLAIVVMALAVRLRSSTDPSSLGLSLNNVLSFNQTLALLLQFWTQLEISLGAIARTREFEEQTPAEAPPASTQPSPPSLPPLLALTHSWPSHGHISIRNLSAHYTPSCPALTNVTISIRAGSKIGICGRSGSGKSSLLSCILRLLEPSNGSIVIDDINLQSLDHQTLRERILTIPQEPFLLGRDLRWNLDPCGQIHTRRRDEEMIDALTKVSLWSLVEKRGGLSALVTTAFLSQGQKQLFSLARAILSKNSKLFTASSSSGPISSSPRGGVLLLDEATSNIDRPTDTLMQRVIRDEFAAFTILVVAHRLETILDSDRVLVLDEGRVIEFDTPQKLLRTESVFKKLYKSTKYEREGDLENSRQTGAEEVEV